MIPLTILYDEYIDQQKLTDQKRAKLSKEFILIKQVRNNDTFIYHVEVISRESTLSKSIHVFNNISFRIDLFLERRCNLCLLLVYYKMTVKNGKAQKITDFLTQHFSQARTTIYF